MTTHLGAAAAQSIEVSGLMSNCNKSVIWACLKDAFILGRILSNPLVNARNISTALEIYEQVRLPLANEVVESSRLAGLVYELSLPAVFGVIEEDTSEVDLTGRVLDAIYEQWTCQWDGVPEDDWKAAEKLLVEKLQ